CLQESNWSYNF
nr:immunoglobulin light chain junction region [Macaca mulatta]